MELSEEDAKLVTLARAAQARTGAPESAAVRDQDGRTYMASAVRLPSLQIGGLDLAVAMAVSSGARSLEAAAVVTDPAATVRLDSMRDLAGSGVPVFVADSAGVVRERSHT